jgi:methylmalonyl-CoA mutase cobalamin-binding domain/chain
MSTTIDNLKDRLHEAILGLDESRAVKLTREILEMGGDPSELIEDLVKPTADEIGEKFDCGDFFLPQLMISGEALEAAMNVLLEALPVAERVARRSVVIGTVKGDIHTIGKNTVAMVLRTGGFGVYDLGVDVEARDFVREAVEKDVDIIALSSLLTTTLPYQSDVIEELKAQGLRHRFKVLVGGGPASQEWANKIGADGYGKDGPEALTVARRVLKAERE